ncbi:hypothetical protein [Deinococcus cellulosilyticus]|uniref:Uncharacterized protein n=1 Tax=Deinococcus cellulosilyticus (strain DSM 18568 / NBRC 106333 / KACC 11606 / 5516J-15) TaxID=1223518 RepID=A0A511N3F7_DEIC1|nr:hypothetical protein [Deinococcus cellulosilyticus]GEM47017.1 hypothetical protein DC3_26520 [Deinococcus cellulosilyticus NBRC 106333 = KACC 11606]
MKTIKQIFLLILVYLLGMLTFYLFSRTTYTGMTATPEMVRCLSYYRIPFYFSENQRQVFFSRKRLDQVNTFCS